MFNAPCSNPRCAQQNKERGENHHHRAAEPISASGRGQRRPQLTPGCFGRCEDETWITSIPTAMFADGRIGRELDQPPGAAKNAILILVIELREGRIPKCASSWFECRGCADPKIGRESCRERV